MGAGAKLEPFAMAKAGTKLAAGASIAPQSAEAANAAAAKKRGAKPAPVLGALGMQLHSRTLSPAQTAYLQVRTQSPGPSLYRHHLQDSRAPKTACLHPKGSLRERVAPLVPPCSAQHAALSTDIRPCHLLSSSRPAY